MPSKADVAKGIIRFVTVFATAVAIILSATHASTAAALRDALVPGLIFAIEKVFLPV